MLEPPEATLPVALLEIAVGGTVARLPLATDGSTLAKIVRVEGGVMIVPSLSVNVRIAMKPVDFRNGMDGLAALVREPLGANPFGGVIHAFRAKRADRVKLLFWDGTGMVMATKRLEQGTFRWPSLREG
jgi:transposase